MPAGRPEIVVDSKMLKDAEALASKGLNYKEIAKVLGMAIDTLIEKRKEYSELNEAIDSGRAKGVALIKNKFFEKAKDGDNHCMTLYLKNYSDLKDKNETALTDGEGKPLKTNFTVTMVKPDHKEGNE